MVGESILKPAQVSCVCPDPVYMVLVGPAPNLVKNAALFSPVGEV